MIKVIKKGTLSFLNETINKYSAVVVGFRAGNKFFRSSLELDDDMELSLDSNNHTLTIKIKNFKDSDYLVMFDKKGVGEKSEIVDANSNV